MPEWALGTFPRDAGEAGKRVVDITTVVMPEWALGTFPRAVPYASHSVDVDGVVMPEWALGTFPHQRG